VLIASSNSSKINSLFKRMLCLALLFTAFIKESSKDMEVEKAKEVSIEDIKWEFSEYISSSS
jgi:hypothetical protein